MKKTIVLLDWELYNPWHRNKELGDTNNTAYFGLSQPNFFKKYLDIELYDDKKSYDKKQHIFVICNIYEKKYFITHLPFYLSLQDKGFQVVVWHFPEYYPEHHPDIYGKLPIFYVENWFWFSEVFRHINGWATFRDNNGIVFHKFNYPRVANRNKLALVPIGRLRPHRIRFKNKIKPFLPNIIYSCVEEGIFLPRNVDFENTFNPYSYRANTINDRYFNPDWYNNTYFSLVSETCVSKQRFKYNKNNYDHALFITEKTFKPIMYRHPFMIYGQPHLLNHLRSIGFETFENLFDESYDQIADNEKRLDKIIENVVELEKTVYKNKKISIYPYDKLTEEKIQHNWNHFFNNQIVEQRLITDIIEPFLEMCE